MVAHDKPGKIVYTTSAAKVDRSRRHGRKL
jgi:hypothetical protein